MRIKVLLFAALREKAGRGEMELEVEKGTTPRDIPGKIPGLEMKEAPPSLRFAVNEDYTAGDTRLKEGDEVALIPPVAGG